MFSTIQSLNQKPKNTLTVLYLYQTQDFYKGKEAEVRVGNNAFALKVEPGMAGGVEMRAHIEDPKGFTQEVIFILNERKHKLFTRSNADLLAETEISLFEALNGFQRTIKHLDGMMFKIKANGCELTGSEEEVYVFENLGMPIYNGVGKGRLFMNVKLAVPTKSQLNQRLTRDERLELNRLLNLLNSPEHSNVEDIVSSKGELPEFVGHRGDYRQFGKLGKQEEEENPFRSFFF